MGGKTAAPLPPNYAPIADASKESAELQAKLGEEQLDWAKQQYNDNKGVTDQVVDSFLSSQQKNQDFADEQQKRYIGEFQPQEDKLVQDADSYASPERKDLEMGRAQGAVSQQFDQARTNAQQQLESFGINPASTRYAALDIGTRTQQAAAQAAAGTQASEYVDATGRALRDNAINVGRGYPGQIAGTNNTAIQAGSQANNAGNSTFATGASAMGTPTSYFGTGNQALGVWGNTLNQGYSNALSSWQANQQASSGWGTALGAVAGIGMTAMGMPGGSKMMGFKDGGAVPDSGNPDAPFHDQLLYLLPAKDDAGRPLGHHEAMDRFFQTGHHLGAFNDEDHAHAHMQRQDYAQKYAQGGAVGAPAPGPAITPEDQGQVSPDLSPSHGAVTDDVPARLNAGEFIIPKDAAAWLGQEKLQKLILKARQDKGMAQAKPTVAPTAPGAAAPQQQPRRAALPVG